jgi:hypothetical protein
MYEYEPYKVTKAGGGSYPLCWKFIPPGNSDKVLARLPASLPTGFHYKDLKFVTTNQTEISYDSIAAQSGSITLTLPGGDDGTDYSLHAVYNTPKGWKQVGRVDVMTRSLKTFNVVIVPLEADIPENEITQIQTNLNAIYSPYGISWTVTVDNEFNNNVNEIQAIVPNYQLTAGDAFLSNYSIRQKSLNTYYKMFASESGTLKEKSVYMFVLNNSPAGAEQTTGDLPLGKQWGYLFGSDVDSHTLAHELGHGMFDLRHTFADDACGKDEKGKTFNNLMDYPAPGNQIPFNSLVCKQWEYMHNTALFGKEFQSDEDAAFSITIHQNLIIEALYKIEGKVEVNERNFKLIVSTGLLADGGSILCEINDVMGDAELTEDLRVFLNSKLDDMLRIYDSPLNVLQQEWKKFWSTSISFPNMRNVFRRSWQYGVEMKQSVDIFTEYWKIVTRSKVKFEKLVITPNNKFKIELQDLTLLENPDITFDLLFRMKDYVTISGDMKTLKLNGDGIDLFPEWITSDVEVSTKTDLSVQYVNKDTHTNLFKVTFNLNASLVNSVELYMSLNSTPIKFPLTCEAERTEIHFDNRYDTDDVLGEWAKIDNELAEIDNLTGDKPIDLGLVLHNVADFYAHSNFIVEYLKWWMDEIKKPGYENLSILTLKPEDLPSYRDVITNASNPQNLNWGAFWNYYRPIMKTEAWTLGLMLDPLKRKGLSIDFHDDVALDGPDSEQGSLKPHPAALCNYHQFARGAAYNHVYQILNDKLK